MRRYIVLALVAAWVLPGCPVVGGDGGVAGGGDEPPAVAPAAELGSVALTANCESSGDGEVQAVSLVGTYDCDARFAVTMSNAGSEELGGLVAQLDLADVELAPVAGPTTPGVEAGEPEGFGLASVDAKGASCEVGGVRAVCDLESLSAGESAVITLEISPSPEVATVTTDVTLAEAG
ncbi:MAG: hypothetical protein ACRDI0_05700 [Actinomycetota bacterium]